MTSQNKYLFLPYKTCFIEFFYKFRFDSLETNPVGGVLKYSRNENIIHKEHEKMKIRLTSGHREEVIKKYFQ